MKSPTPASWSRQEFLTATSLLGLGAMTPSFLKNEPYIDAHSHVWSSDLARWPRAATDPRGHNGLPHSFTPEELLGYAEPCGVGRVVLIQWGASGFDNAYILDSIARLPGRFSGVAIVDHDSPGLVGEINRLAAGGVRGFRIRPLGQPRTWLDSAGMGSLWSHAARSGLAVCPLIDPDALPSVDRMAERHPETNVVIDHLCRIGASGTVRDEDVAALCGLARRPNVHVKVSAFYALGKKAYPYTDLIPMIRRLVEAYGSNRLMWGTDCPFQVSNGYKYADSLALVKDHLDFLNASDKQAMLHGTANKVFFGKVSPA